MSAKSMNDIIELWVDAERDRMGPITQDEIDRFLDGTLPEPRATRVRALMIYDPALTPLLREHRTRWPKAMLVAFLLVGATTAALFLRRDHPTIAARYELVSEHARGPAPEIMIRGGEANYVFVTHLDDSNTETQYRVELLREPDTKLLREDNVRARGGAITLDVPGAGLTPGRYRIDFYDRDSLVQSHRIRVIEKSDNSK